MYRLSFLSIILDLRCKVNGQPGNGKSQGSCEDNEVCAADGSCKCTH